MGQRHAPAAATVPGNPSARARQPGFLPGRLAALCGLLLACPAGAAQVSGLAALHHDGQTFITWTGPPGTGWKYWVYRAPFAIEGDPDLEASTIVGWAADSSWCDRRLSSLSGTVYGFCIDSLAAPLDSTRGLFVWTPGTAGPVYYAVTCQAIGSAENRQMTPGENSLVSPLTEVPALPRPVYQRTLIGPWGHPADVYTLWTCHLETPFFPAMSNRPGGEPHDCSIHHGAAGGGLMFHPHVRGGSFYLADAGSGMGGEWQITMDDFMRTPDVNTFWFGYHAGYNIESDAIQPLPINETVWDFTARRSIFTLEWARRNFPVDTSRVYVMGSSMGGIAGVFLAMWRPDLIAATMVSVPLVDFSFQSDPNPLCQFNAGGAQRLTCDRLWGEVGKDLRMPDGARVYDHLNAGALAAGLEARFVPPILAFSGRNDVTIGWAEKIPFYQAMNLHRAGGAFFWDNRTHTNTATAGAWAPVQDYRYLYRFRNDLSFPALSNCSADGDPGDGHAADGDSIGSINGFVEWSPFIVDDPEVWQVALTLRDLPTLWRVVAAPESLTVDVTPRRLQAFVVSPGAQYPWRVSRTVDGEIVQSGTVYADGMGVLTIPAVKVFRTGSVLRLGTPTDVGVGHAPSTMAGATPRIGPLPCPIRGPCALTLEWPRPGRATLDVDDVSGRLRLGLYQGGVMRGRSEVRLDPGELPSGVYFVVAREDGMTTVRRFVYLH